MSTPKANVGLRPYFPDTDKKYVHYLFYTTYFNLAPQAVFKRVYSPYILTPWILIYAISMYIVTSFQLSTTVFILTSLFTTAAVFGLGFLGLFWYVDKIDISNRVLEALENDLKEPDTYYRGNMKKGNFWVLTLNNEIVGCIGMDQTLEPVYLQESKPTQSNWWTDLVDVTRSTYRIAKGNPTKKPMLFSAHKPNEASVRRLAVKTDCQSHGLSTVLLKRVAFWAHAHQIEYLYADCNELQNHLANILVNKHGYSLVETKKHGYFTSTSTYRLDVKLWMSKELERRKEEQILEELQKEEEELKEYASSLP